MTKILLVLSLIVHISTFAQAQDEEKFTYKFYQGTVGKASVAAHLHHKSGSFSGFYFYKNGAPLQLNGILEDGRIMLEERPKGQSEPTGYWSLSQDYGNQVSGLWYSSDSSRSLPVVLYEKSPALSFQYFVREFNFQKSYITQNTPEQEEGVYTWEYPISMQLLVPQAFRLRPVVRDSLYMLILNSTPERLEKHINTTVFNAYTNNVPDEAGEYKPNSYQYFVEQQVMWQSARLLVLEEQSYIYTGGAHGLPSTHYYNIDLSTGQQVTLQNLFSPNQLTKIASLITERFGKENLLSPVEESLSGFYLCPGGVGFYFNVYGIAPYAAGPQEFYFSFTELENFIGPITAARSYQN